jgi:hypothetical protein
MIAALEAERMPMTPHLGNADPLARWLGILAGDTGDRDLRQCRLVS